MRIIKIQQIQQSPGGIQQTLPGGVQNPVQQRDVTSFLASLSSSIPGLSSIKNNPALLKSLSLLLGTFAQSSEKIGTIVPKIRDFCKKHDPSFDTGEQMNADVSQKTTSGVAPAIPGK